MDRKSRLVFGCGAASALAGAAIFVAAELGSRQFLAQHPGATYDYWLPWSFGCGLIWLPCCVCGAFLLLRRRMFPRWAVVVGWVLFLSATTSILFAIGQAIVLR